MLSPICFHFLKLLRLFWICFRISLLFFKHTSALAHTCTHTHTQINWVNWDCVKCIGQLVENWYLKNIDSSNQWIWYISPFTEIFFNFPQQYFIVFRSCTYLFSNLSPRISYSYAIVNSFISLISFPNCIFVCIIQTYTHNWFLYVDIIYHLSSSYASPITSNLIILGDRALGRDLGLD